MAEQFTLHGRTIDWGTVDIKMPGGTTAIGVKSISYNDELEKSPVYGKGRTPIAYGVGNHKAQGSLSMLRQHADEFEDALLATSDEEGVLMHKPFTMTVNYANSDQPIRTDILRKCAITKRDYQGKQGDTELAVSYDFQILGGIWRNKKKPA